MQGSFTRKTIRSFTSQLLKFLDVASDSWLCWWCSCYRRHACSSYYSYISVYILKCSASAGILSVKNCYDSYEKLYYEGLHTLDWTKRSRFCSVRSLPFLGIWTGTGTRQMFFQYLYDGFPAFFYITPHASYPLHWLAEQILPNVCRRLPQESTANDG